MKRVIIVRHGKSVPYGYDDDFNRDLKDRGEIDAKHIVNELVNRLITVDLIISSPAKRALRTAEIYANGLGYDHLMIRQDNRLYDGITTHDFVEMLHGLPATMDTIMVFGHNPTVFYLVNNLVKYFNSDMPTCSTVCIDFKIDNWRDLEVRTGHLTFQIVPSQLK